MAGTYQTAGRQRLLAFLYEHPDRQFTAEELSEEMNRDKGREDEDRNGRDGDPPASSKAGREGSRSTLYRHLSELCTEGTVRKYRNDKQSAYVYQFVGSGDCCHHFHLKCERCGRLIHLDCAVSEELLSHIRTDHHFRVDSGSSILYGVCEECGDGD